MLTNFEFDDSWPDDASPPQPVQIEPKPPFKTYAFTRSRHLLIHPSTDCGKCAKCAKPLTAWPSHPFRTFRSFRSAMKPWVYLPPTTSTTGGID